jgi:hypothetical protein
MGKRKRAKEQIMICKILHRKLPQKIKIIIKKLGCPGRVSSSFFTTHEKSHAVEEAGITHFTTEVRVVSSRA